jgi:hypothetical protein
MHVSRVRAGAAAGLLCSAAVQQQRAWVHVAGGSIAEGLCCWQQRLAEDLASCRPHMQEICVSHSACCMGMSSLTAACAPNQSQQ